MQQLFKCGEITVSRNQEKRKKDASENALKSQKHNWTTELLKNTVQHEQYVNKQFNDRKKADLIEKCTYSKGDQIIVVIKYSHCHQRRFVSIKKDFLTIRSVF